MTIISLTGIKTDDWGPLYSGDTIHEGESLLLDLESYAELNDDAGSAGDLYLEIDTKTDFTALKPIANKFRGIAIRLDTFADGRAFSLATRLRQDLNYQGEIRATGNTIPDQALFLLRSGFDSVNVTEERQKAFRAALARYSDFYQSDVRGTLSAGHLRHMQHAKRKSAS